MVWISYLEKEPAKELYSHYLMKVETETDNFGKQIREIKIFWDGSKWNISNEESLTGGLELPEDFFEDNKPIYWREYRAPNLADE